ncbi:MAG: hypothetical protein PHI37_03790 [Candidatus Gracilibacteria bacterium]|nr:hypothetical protein [Candidatus Gracilibacteria bacterium]
MLDNINIFINKEGKIEENKSFIIDIFSNKYELAILTFSIYLVGVLYQILKLIGGFTSNIKLGNLMFFSFSNSVNDFLIIFGVSFIFFFLSFIVTFSLIKILNFLNLNNNKCIKIIIICFVSIFYIFIMYLNNGFESVKTSIYLLIPIILSIIISGLLIFNNFNKKLFYIFLGLFLIYSFYLMLYDGIKYYACDEFKCNSEKENCVLLEYKNDKYGFTLYGDIYKIDEFKSFFTSDYFTSKSYLNNECKE